MQPRYYQVAANAAVWAFLADKPGNPVVVLPTGAGKTIVCAMMVKQAIEFGGRVIVLAHRKELIQQCFSSVTGYIEGVSAGIYSAGIGQRDTDSDVVFAGIQSVFRKAAEFGNRHFVIVDECHLCSADDDSMYGQFIGDLRALNPKLRVAGMSATPFRTGEGPICGAQKLFQRIVFEAQTKQLIDEGFLCSITNKPAKSAVDVSGLKLRGGEFVESDLQSVFNVDEKVKAAVAETVEKCQGRKSILVFSSGVKHAENVAETLRKITSDRVEVVTGETLPIERQAILSDFKQGALRWLVNCDVLTTGFDAPCIDAIAVLRATMSPGLFAQMVGRGLRKHPSKTDCLILDFGGNIDRHGPLDDPGYGRASVGSGKSTAAEANGRGKPCPNCGLDVAARLTECMDCGFVFPVKEARHSETSDSESQLTGELPPESWIVSSVVWRKHTKRNDPDAPPTLRLDYDCTKDGGFKSDVDIECRYQCGSAKGEYRENGPHIELLCSGCQRHQKFVAKSEAMDRSGSLLKTQISEWVCIEHTGFARSKAALWWQQRSESPVPDTVEEALSLLNRGACRMSSNITTKKDGKWYRITAATFVDDKPEEWEPEREAVVYDGFDDEVPF